MGTIFCFGDSNTWGYEPLTQGRYRPEHRWVDIIGKESGWTTVNVGMNGRQIPHTPYEIAEVMRILDAAADPDPGALYSICCKEDYQIVSPTLQAGDGGPGQRQRIILEGPVLFWILLGTNDIQMNYGYTAEKAVERMRRLLSEMLLHDAVSSGRVQLRVLGPARVEVGPWSDARQQQELLRMGPLEERLCRELAVPFTDLGELEIDLAADGDHFSKKGHRTVADVLMELL